MHHGPRLPRLFVITRFELTLTNRNGNEGASTLLAGSPRGVNWFRVRDFKYQSMEENILSGQSVKSYTWPVARF